MKFPLLCLISFAVLSCNKGNSNGTALSKSEFLKTVNKDSLVFDKKANAYFDRYGDGSGSLYRFDSLDKLTFYCFLNVEAYPYAEYFNEKGEIEKTEGRPSLRNIYEVNSDSTYTFYFLYSTFRKSDYKVQSIVNKTDTLENSLSQSADFSNVGGFSIVVRTKDDVLKTEIINHARFFDNVRNAQYAFSDTINLKNVIQ
jgi:hypothetical protein